jgi:hypothetical protein
MPKSSRKWQEVGGRSKPRNSLGKLLEEFKPKSYQLEIGIAAAAVFLLSLPIMGAAPFMPEGRLPMFCGGLLLFIIAISTGVFAIFFAARKDRVEIRQDGLRLKMRGEVIDLEWWEVGEMNSRTEYNQYIEYGKGTTKYACQMDTAIGYIELSEKFLGQFEDPPRILKLIRKHTGKSLRYIELPGGADDGRRSRFAR